MLFLYNQLFALISFWNVTFFIFLIWSILNSKKITSSNLYFEVDCLAFNFWKCDLHFHLQKATYFSLLRNKIQNRQCYRVQFYFKKEKKIFCSEWGTLNFVGCICLSVHLLQNCAAATKFIYLLLISVVAYSPSFCVYSYSGVHSHGFKFMS